MKEMSELVEIEELESKVAPDGGETVLPMRNGMSGSAVSLLD